MYKKFFLVFFLVATLLFISGCMGQVKVPLPKESIELKNVKVKIVGAEDRTIHLSYSLDVKNKGEIELDEVVLQDFELPENVTMDSTYFDIKNLKPGESRTLQWMITVSDVDVPISHKQTWKVPFSIKNVVNNNYVTESGFYYEFTLLPP